MGQVSPGYSQDEIEQLLRAEAGTLQVTPQIAGPAAPAVETTDNVAEAARMRRFALWSILGYGVLVLGYMTWRLFQQLNAPEKP